MRKLGLIIILLWLGVSLACNFPVVTATPPALPGHPTLAFNTRTPIPLVTQTDSLQPTLAIQNTGIPSFPGLATATEEGSPPGIQNTPVPPEIFSYQAQSGDTLDAVAKRFGVQPEMISSPQEIPAEEMISIGQILTIPNLVGSPAYPSAVLPDSEVIYSPAAIDFNIQDYISAAGGYLNIYSQVVDAEPLTGAQIVQRVAESTSTNPRLLLAFIEYRSKWVSSVPPIPNLARPLGFQVAGYDGLYLQLSLLGKLLNIGYYGWRQGTLTEIEFTDKFLARLAPQLNAGSVALQYLFARLYKQEEWQARLYGDDGLVHMHESMFGDPWARAALVEPLFQSGMQPPALELPFAPGERWSLTAGPHPDWNTGTPPGALDFAPITGQPPCSVSVAWARAAAAGVILRASNGVVVLDLDGDGREQTGWVLLYMHIAQQDRAAVGARLNTDDPIGHPSCEGGESTGSHVHLARKFNGEWIGAGGPWPFILSGWTTVPGDTPYKGTLVKGEQVVTAYSGGTYGSTIIR